MRTDAPPLAPIFRSHLQARLLAAVLLGTEAHSIADLAAGLSAPESTVYREVERLTRAGIFRTRRVGRIRFVESDDTSPVVSPLRDLITVAYGPQTLIQGALTGIRGIDLAFIYGSWAARFRGENGPPPADIDVLIVGRPDRDDVDDALAAVQRELHREVNSTYVSSARWADRVNDPFLSTLAERPLVELAIADGTQA